MSEASNGPRNLKIALARKAFADALRAYGRLAGSAGTIGRDKNDAAARAKRPAGGEGEKIAHIDDGLRRRDDHDDAPAAQAGAANSGQS